MEIKIAPSILSADFGHIADEAARLEQSGADMVHIDVMDGHFVHNITMGPKMVAAINRNTSLFLDVHLMIYNPFEYIEKFVESGADRITIHFEATEEVESTLEYIRKCGIKAGLAFNPETSMSMVPKFLNMCDMVLLMTVHPGFSGQAFIPEVLEKVAFVRETCEKLHIYEGGVMLKDDAAGKELAPFDIQVDGGIDLKTAPDCVKAGANILVSGSHLYSQPDLKSAIERLREAAKQS